MRAYTPDLPPDAWIIEELERLRRVPEPERPGLHLPLPLPSPPSSTPPPSSPSAPSEEPEQAPSVIIIDL